MISFMLSIFFGTKTDYKLFTSGKNVGKKHETKAIYFVVCSEDNCFSSSSLVLECTVGQKSKLDLECFVVL